MACLHPPQAVTRTMRVQSCCCKKLNRRESLTVKRLLWYVNKVDQMLQIPVAFQFFVYN